MKYERRLYDTYKECVGILGEKNLEQLQEVKRFMLKQQVEALLPFEPTEKEMLAYTE